ncbi:hypothetical protein DL771_009228 [Monosporascus sp. 5C6A]|nr:hypothetical protein DL771_009228 [Monosporascus sp. 5C6A]
MPRCSPIVDDDFESDSSFFAEDDSGGFDKDDDDGSTDITGENELRGLSDGLESDGEPRRGRPLRAIWRQPPPT